MDGKHHAVKGNEKNIHTKTQPAIKHYQLFLCFVCVKSKKKKSIIWLLILNFVDNSFVFQCQKVAHVM